MSSKNVSVCWELARESLLCACAIALSLREMTCSGGLLPTLKIMDIHGQFD